jgi:hypothetical protein
MKFKIGDEVLVEGIIHGANYNLGTIVRIDERTFEPRFIYEVKYTHLVMNNTGYADRYLIPATDLAKLLLLTEET